MFSVNCNHPYAVLLLLMAGVFSFFSPVKAQTKRISLEISPLYSYMDVRLGQYAVRNNPGIEDPKPGLGGAVKYEIDINNLFSVSAGLSYGRRYHAYTSVLDPSPSPARLTPYKFTYDDSYDFMGIPMALHVNYLKHPTFRVYQSFGTQFGFWVQSNQKRKWYFMGREPELHTGKNTSGKTDVVISFSSSIGISKSITKRLAFKIEPGFSYMATNFFEDNWANMRYFDLKADVGLVFTLNNPKD